MSASWAWRLVPVPIEHRDWRSTELDKHALYRLSCTDPNGHEWLDGGPSGQNQIFLNDEDVDVLRTAIGDTERSRAGEILVELLEALSDADDAQTDAALTWWADDFDGSPDLVEERPRDQSPARRIGDALRRAMEVTGWAWGRQETFCDHDWKLIEPAGIPITGPYEMCAKCYASRAVTDG